MAQSDDDDDDDDDLFFFDSDDDNIKTSFCREWKCQWSSEGDSCSLVAAQIALETVFGDLKKHINYEDDESKATIDYLICEKTLDLKVNIIQHNFRFFCLSREYFICYYSPNKDVICFQFSFQQIVSKLKTRL